MKKSQNKNSVKMDSSLKAAFHSRHQESVMNATNAQKEKTGATGAINSNKAKAGAAAKKKAKAKAKRKNK